MWFSHSISDIIKYAGRPFRTLEEMNHELINRWNNKIRKDDTVIHLGDFAFGSKEEIKELRNKLNGNIILIRGSHDKKITGSLGFLIVNGSIELENFILSHYPLKKEGIPKGLINIHGHMHAKESSTGINVSVEKVNYEPIELEGLKKA